MPRRLAPAAAPASAAATRPGRGRVVAARGCCDDSCASSGKKDERRDSKDGMKHHKQDTGSLARLFTPRTSFDVSLRNTNVHDETPANRQSRLVRTASAEASRRPRRRSKRGEVLFLPDLSFAVEPREGVLFTPSILGSAKNASFDPATGRLGGTNATGADADALACVDAPVQRMPRRRWSSALLPAYRGRIVRGRASFRPAEIAGRPTSWRKDDTRLHVDSFPGDADPAAAASCACSRTSTPTAGRARGGWAATSKRWRAASRRSCGCRCRAAAICCALLRVTKTPRSAYDALMLQLHDLDEGAMRRSSGLAAEPRRFSRGLDVAGVHG